MSLKGVALKSGLSLSNVLSCDSLLPESQSGTFFPCY